jgi:hypothetical protein
MRKNGNKIGLSFGVITSAVLVFYFSGSVIHIPSGTHEGGVASALGVGIILTAMFAVILFTNWFRRKNI